MRIDIATLFPEMCEAVLGESIIGRARKSGAIDVYCHQIREYTLDKHRRVDDIPYGGGMGMVMQCEPIYNCYKAICEQIGKKPHTIYMSPKGSVLTQKKTIELSKKENILIICGHYEGVDQRIIDKIVDEEISIGDYVLTGGEIPAMVLVDAICRYVPEVLGNSETTNDETFSNNLLEYPQYTRPAEFMGLKVPDVLVSGNHQEVDKWRKQMSIEITKKNRPDLLKED